uniref:Uncharacterized protein n=1 Tax=Entomoneis paludosa TaxID=265537 RepID=A0A7S2YF79_9STRA|mmetsp:Transcript_30592/g.63898  ORF Transcript_30592/g.63898 Transcript_30592/m.63898 type:complete len:303 (+) Transcript_30592:121-1029(+)
MAPNSNDDTTPSKREPADKVRLSTVSAKYDIGDKGYLTEVEKSMRDMDESGRGHLTNEQVAGIKEETLALRNANKLLKKWIIAMVVLVIFFGISNVCVSIIAARMSKDTSVNAESGLLTVKDHEDVSVMTVGTSHQYKFVFTEDRCVSAGLVADMFAQTMAGTDLTAVFIEGQVQDDDSMVVRALKPNPDTSFMNQTHVCFGTTVAVAGEVVTCIDLTDHQCEVQNGNSRGRQLSVEEHNQMTQAKRKLMHGRLARHLYVHGEDEICESLPREWCEEPVERDDQHPVWFPYPDTEGPGVGVY